MRTTKPPDGPADSYWKKREEEQRKKDLKDDKAASSEINKIYHLALTEMTLRLEAWYTRYAGENGISMKEAKLAADFSDIRDLAVKAAQYVATKDMSPKANAEMEIYVSVKAETPLNKKGPSIW